MANVIADVTALKAKNKPAGPDNSAIKAENTVCVPVTFELKSVKDFTKKGKLFCIPINP